MFLGCENLLSIDVSNFNIAEVTNLKDMFNGCQSLTSIDLSKFIPKELTRMEYMMYKCYNLNYIDVSPFTDKNNQYINVFSVLPDKGEIKITKSLYYQVRDQIPDDWKIDFIE